MIRRTITVINTILVCVLFACEVPDNSRTMLSQSTAIPVVITDTIRIDPPNRLVDYSMSNFSPIISEEVMYFPTTTLDGPIDQINDPPGRTGITAVEIATMDTLWVSLVGTPSGEIWPIIGSLVQYHDSLIMISFEDGMYQFSASNGDYRTDSYNEQMRIACRRIRDVRGDWFSSLDFVSDGERIAYRLYTDDYNEENNRVCDIVVTNSSLIDQYVYTLHYHFCQEIEIQDKTYLYEGTIADYVLTDSSLCFHTVEPELFFEIGFDGILIRNILLGNQELNGPVLPLAPPYQGRTINTRTINRRIVVNNGHLYTLRTGLNSNGIRGAEILDTDLNTNSAILYQLDSTVGWTKFSGNGRIFIADWYELPTPNQDGLYQWTGEDYYALISLW